MENTLDLLGRAVAGAPSERQLAFDLGLSEAALRKSRERGNLSPHIAGALAARLGEDIAQWMARAAIEAASRTPSVAKLRRDLKKAGAQFL